MTDKPTKRQLTDAELKQRRDAAKKSTGPKHKKGKPLSEAEIKQRQEAAAQSTGPKTLEGKATSSRNAFKHGLYSRGNQLMKEQFSVGAFARPCRTTCKYHPENPAVQIPCTLVVDKYTQAGGDCLDKTVYVQAFDSLLQTMQTGSPDHMHEVLAGEAAGALEMLYHLRNEISDKGFVIYVPIFNKEGAKTGEKPVLNPAMPMYNKLLGEFGINLAELLASPKSLSALGKVEEGEDTLAQLLGTALSHVGGNRVIEHKGRKS